MKENCCRYMLVQMWIIKGAVTCHPLPRVEKLVLVFGEVDDEKGDRSSGSILISPDLKSAVNKEKNTGSDFNVRRRQD